MEVPLSLTVRNTLFYGSGIDSQLPSTSSALKVNADYFTTVNASIINCVFKDAAFQTKLVDFMAQDTNGFGKCSSCRQGGRGSWGERKF